MADMTSRENALCCTSFVIFDFYLVFTERQGKNRNLGRCSGNLQFSGETHRLSVVVVVVVAVFSFFTEQVTNTPECDFI